MSNLGLYQWLTTTAKKVGGPINLLLLAGSLGAAIYKGGEMAVKWCVNTVKTRKANKVSEPALRTELKLCSVTSPGKSDEGLEFSVGEQFYALKVDDNSVLVEKIGDKNNPCFVSAELLHRISDYK